MLRCLSCLFAVFSLTILDAGCWYPYVETEGWGADWHQGGGATLFVPLQQSGRDILFGEARGQRLRHQSVGSGGVGYRRLVNSCIAVGANGFLDYSHFDAGGDYLQFGAGIELLGSCFEARLNGYILNDNRTRLFQERQIEELALVGVDLVNIIRERLEEECAYSGFDAEGGLVACIGPGYARAYAGYFHYNCHRARDIRGPRVRLVYDWDDPFKWCGARLSVGWQYTYDSVRRSESGGFIQLRVPLCPPKRGKRCWKSSLCRRMGDRVWRERGVVAIRRKIDRTLIEPVVGPNGNELQLYFVDRNGGGPGTQTDPTTLDNAEALSGPEDVIFALNDEGVIDVNNTFTMKNFQQLLGFGDQPMRVVSFGPGIDIEITDLTGSGRATLNGNGDNIVTLADSTFVCGIKLTGGNNAIDGVGTPNVRVEDVIIENPQSSGLHLLNAASPSIEQTSVAMAGTQGFFFEGGSNIALLDVRATGSANEGMLFDGVDTISIGGLSAVIENETGLSFVDGLGSVNVTGTTVMDNSLLGVNIFGGTANYVFNGNTIEQSGGGLVTIDSTNSAIAFTGGTLRNTNGSGITVQNTIGGGVLFDTPEVDTAFSTAMTFANNNASIAINDATISTGAGVTGLQITGGTPAASVTFVGNGALTQAAGGTAVDIDGTAAILDLRALQISNDSANGVNGLRVRDTIGGQVLFEQVSATNTMAADSALFESNDAPITFDTLTVGSPGGRAVSGVMGDGDITFRQLNVDQASTGVELTATAADAGQFIVTGDGTPDSGGVFQNVFVEGLSATDVRGVDLNFMNIFALNGDAIAHTTSNRTDATLNLNSSRLDGGGSGVDLDVNLSGALDATVVSNAIGGGNESAFNAHVSDAAALVLALNENTLSSTVAAGASISNATGTLANLTIRSLSSNTVESAGNGGILFDSVLFNAPGEVPGGATVIGSFSPVSGDGLRLNMVDGAIRFDSLDSANDSGTGLFVRDAGGKAGGFSLATGGGTIDTTNGPAMDIDPVQLDVTLASVRSIMSPSEGVLLNTVTGLLDIQGGQIDRAVLSAFRVLGDSDAEITYSGTIVNETGLMIEIDGAVGGSALFNGASYLDDGGDGVSVTGSAMDVTLDNAEIINSPLNPGVRLINNTGSFDLNDSTIRMRALAGVLGEQVQGDVALDTCVVDQIGGLPSAAGIDLTGVNGSPINVTVAASEITAIGDLAAVNARGINLVDIVGNIAVTDTRVTGVNAGFGTIAGLNIEQVAGTVIASDLELSFIQGAGFTQANGIRSIDLAGTLSVTNPTMSIISALISHGMLVINMDTPLDITVAGGTIGTTIETGIEIEAQGSSMVTASLEQGLHLHSLQGDGVQARIFAGNGASLAFNVDNCDFGGTPLETIEGDAINIATSGICTGSTLTYQVTDNTFTNVDGHAAVAVRTGFIDDSNMIGTINGNVSDEVGFGTVDDSAFDLRIGGNTSGSHVITMDSNTTNRTANAAVLVLNSSSVGSLCINVTNHTDTNSDQSGLDFAAYDLRQTSLGEVCAATFGNSSDNLLGIRFEASGLGLYNVADRDNVAANNSVPQVTFDPNIGAFGDVSACPPP